jgi:hypothetical protein
MEGKQCNCGWAIKTAVYLAWLAAILFWISNLFMDGGNILGMSEQHLLTEVVIFSLLALGCGKVCKLSHCRDCGTGTCNNCGK